MYRNSEIHKKTPLIHINVYNNSYEVNEKKINNYFFSGTNLFFFVEIWHFFIQIYTDVFFSRFQFHIGIFFVNRIFEDSLEGKIGTHSNIQT